MLHPEQPIISTRLELNLPKKPNWMDPQPVEPKTASEWFASRFPDATSKYGCPFLEMNQTNIDRFSKITPVAINIDFFAAMLGGDQALGHQVVYCESEVQFYYREPVLQLYKPTTAEKLQNFYRAMLMRCAQETHGDIDKLNLFNEFRNDKNSRAVTNRAKSILAADSSFFSATGPNQRIKGMEWHERIARRIVEELLTCEPGHTLLLADAYAAFCRNVKLRSLEPIKCSDFKAMMIPLVKDEYNVCLRNDLVIDERQGVRGWKNMKLLNQTLPG